MPKMPVDENGKEIQLSKIFNQVLTGNFLSKPVVDYYTSFAGSRNPILYGTYAFGLLLIDTIRQQENFEEILREVDGSKILHFSQKEVQKLIEGARGEEGLPWLISKNKHPYEKYDYDFRRDRTVREEAIENICARIEGYIEEKLNAGGLWEDILKTNISNNDKIKGVIDLSTAFDYEIKGKKLPEGFEIKDALNSLKPDETARIYQLGLSMIKTIRDDKPELFKGLKGETIKDKAALAYYKLLHKDYDDLSKGGEGFSRS